MTGKGPSSIGFDSLLVRIATMYTNGRLLGLLLMPRIFPSTRRVKMRIFPPAPPPWSGNFAHPKAVARANVIARALTLRGPP